VNATITGNEICDNAAQRGGGVILDTKIDTILRRNIVAFNRAAVLCTAPGCEESLRPGQSDPDPTVEGGGLYEHDCGLLLDNNTFHRNTGSDPESGALHAVESLFGGSRIANHVFSENDGFGVWLVSTDPPAVHNDFFANLIGDCNCNECVHAPASIHHSSAVERRPASGRQLGPAVVVDGHDGPESRGFETRTVALSSRSFASMTADKYAKDSFTVDRGRGAWRGNGRR